MRWLLLSVIGFGAVAVAGGPPADPVVIDLKESATATGTVRISDVGTLRGGTQVVRDRVAALDLAEIPRGGKPIEVSRRLVEVRLKLAGWDADAVRVHGPDRVSVAATAPKAATPPPVSTMAPAIIRPRQRVVMTVKIGAMTVSAIGEAVEAGRLGQTIKLKNIDSQKVVSGTVVGPGAVEVEPGGGS